MEIDTNGTEKFELSMVNATLKFGIRLELINSADEWSEVSCQNRQLRSLEDGGNVIITEITFPLKYDDVNFKFHGLGDGANTLVNIVGVYLLQTQEELIVGKVRDEIKQNVNSLIC